MDSSYENEMRFFFENISYIRFTIEVASKFCLGDWDDDIK
jgi:hypothetical protein